MSNARRLSAPEFTSLDLFAGCGGVSLGLEAAGFKSMGAVEIDPVAAKTYETNFGPRLIHRFGPERGDMRTVDLLEVRRELVRAGVKTLNLLVAAPPCQGFSRVGRGKLDSKTGRRGSFAQDLRNVLYEHAIEAISILKPHAVLFENVTGILHLRGRNMAEVVCEAIEAAGYQVRCTLLNSAWYGVPQCRERVVIIGFRKDLKLTPEFPTIQNEVRLARGHLTGADLDPRAWKNPAYFIPTDKLQNSVKKHRAVAVKDALGDLPPFTAHLEAQAADGKYRALRGLMPEVPYRPGRSSQYARQMRNWSSLPPVALVSDHFCRWTPRDFETFRRMRPGDRYPVAVDIATRIYEEERDRCRSEGRRPPPRKQFVPGYSLQGFPDKWRKLIPGEPSWTVTAHLGKDTYSHIHYDDAQARTITMREAARLQSFPDGFRFAGNMGDVFRQIGNAVPPLLAKALGESIATQLRQVRQVSWPILIAPPQPSSPERSPAGAAASETSSSVEAFRLTA